MHYIVVFYVSIVRRQCITAYLRRDEDLTDFQPHDLLYHKLYEFVGMLLAMVAWGVGAGDASAMGGSALSLCVAPRHTPGHKLTPL